MEGGRGDEVARESLTMAALLTLDEVAEELAVSCRTVRRLVDSRKLGAVRILSMYRVPRAELDAYISRATMPALPERPRFQHAVGPDVFMFSDGSTASRRKPRKKPPR